MPLNSLNSTGNDPSFVRVASNGMRSLQSALGVHRVVPPSLRNRRVCDPSADEPGARCRDWHEASESRINLPDSSDVYSSESCTIWRCRLPGSGPSLITCRMGANRSAGALTCFGFQLNAEKIAEEAIGDGLSAVLEDFRSRDSLHEFSLLGFLIYFYLEGKIRNNGRAPSSARFQDVVDMAGNVAECGAALVPPGGSECKSLLALAVGDLTRDVADVKRDIDRLWMVGSQRMAERLGRFRRIQRGDPGTLSDMFLITSFDEAGASLTTQAARARLLRDKYLPFQQVWAMGAAAFAEGIVFAATETEVHSATLETETFVAGFSGAIEESSATTNSELNNYRVALCKIWARRCRPDQLELISGLSG